MVDEGALGRLVIGQDGAGPDPQAEWKLIVSRELGAFGHAPGCGAGNFHAQIKLLADANDLRRCFGLQGKSADAAQERGRTADLRHGKQS